MEIYIVEDDVTVISILEDIIEDNELGTVCGTTEGGPANVDEILALEPDVILVDFLMPGKDGVELVRELKEKGCGIVYTQILRFSICLYCIKCCFFYQYIAKFIF